MDILAGSSRDRRAIRAAANMARTGEVMAARWKRRPLGGHSGSHFEGRHDRRLEQEHALI